MSQALTPRARKLGPLTKCYETRTQNLFLKQNLVAVNLAYWITIKSSTKYDGLRMLCERELKLKVGNGFNDKYSKFCRLMSVTVAILVKKF